MEAAAAVTGDERRAVLQRMVQYEDVGPGSYYDDAGSPGRQPHLVKGDSYDASAMMDPKNRPSQNTIAYSLNDTQGVAFHYTDLDKTATYKVRVCLVRPRMPEQAGVPEGVKFQQNIVADETYLAKDVEIPLYTAGIFEYDVPGPLTSDGTLRLVFERGTGSIAIVVSDVWLLKQ